MSFNLIAIHKDVENVHVIQPGKPGDWQISYIIALFNTPANLNKQKRIGKPNQWEAEHLHDMEELNSRPQNTNLSRSTEKNSNVGPPDKTFSIPTTEPPCHHIEGPPSTRECSPVMLRSEALIKKPQIIRAVIKFGPPVAFIFKPVTNLLL